jgi:hypothetical protein
MVNPSHYTEHYMYHLFSSQSVGVRTPIPFMCLAVAPPPPPPTTYYLLILMLKRVNVIYCFDFSDVMWVVSSQEDSMLAVLLIRTRLYVEAKHRAKCSATIL